MVCSSLPSSLFLLFLIVAVMPGGVLLPLRFKIVLPVNLVIPPTANGK
jgi:hypothetical protein